MFEQGIRRLSQLIAPSEPVDVRVQGILQRLEEAIHERVALAAFLKLLDSSQPRLFHALAEQIAPVVAAKSLTLKILNLCLAKYHFLARSTTVLARPFGLNIDPSD